MGTITEQYRLAGEMLTAEQIAITKAREEVFAALPQDADIESWLVAMFDADQAGEEIIHGADSTNVPFAIRAVDLTERHIESIATALGSTSLPEFRDDGTTIAVGETSRISFSRNRFGRPGIIDVVSDQLEGSQAGFRGDAVVVRTANTVSFMHYEDLTPPAMPTHPGYHILTLTPRRVHHALGLPQEMILNDRIHSIPFAKALQVSRRKV